MQSSLLKQMEMEMDPNNNKRKRQLTSGESSCAGHLSPPAIRWRRTVLEIRKERNLLDFLLLRPQIRGEISGSLFLIQFEDTIRRAVREELQKSFHYLNLPLPRLLPDQNMPARYQLRFMNKIKSPTFTTDVVQDEKGEPIKVAIYDSCTGSIVSPNSSLSSIVVRITALDAEFLKNKGENWSRSEFNQSVLRDREGKGPILTRGGGAFRLENGRGTSGNIIFGDNSSPTKSGFCLGVMVEVKGGEEGYFNGERVQEGVSNCFRVKDRRGKASRKPDQLELKHNVQSVKNIGKDRASLLESNGIETVKDFLHWYYHNQPQLRKILGIKSDLDKGWRAMVEHAKECDNEFHATCYGLNNIIQPQQVPMEKQINILNPNSNQIYYPININPNHVSPLEEALAGMITRKDQFSNISEVSVHRLGRNVSCITNGDPNPCENNIIDQDDMSECYGQLSTICEFSSIDISNERISTASCEQLAEIQSPPFHETNVMTIAGGNMPNVGSMQHTSGGGSDLLEDLLANAESTPSNIRQFPSRNDSFDPGTCHSLVQDFVASISCSVNVMGPPLSPRRKGKIKALLKWITAPAVSRRKRARIAPPANQTMVPAV